MTGWFLLGDDDSRSLGETFYSTPEDESYNTPVFLCRACISCQGHGYSWLRKDHLVRTPFRDGLYGSRVRGKSDMGARVGYSHHYRGVVVKFEIRHDPETPTDLHREQLRVEGRTTTGRAVLRRTSDPTPLSSSFTGTTSPRRS